MRNHVDKSDRTQKREITKEGNGVPDLQTAKQVDACAAASIQRANPNSLTIRSAMRVCSLANRILTPEEHDKAMAEVTGLRAGKKCVFLLLFFNRACSS